MDDFVIGPTAEEMYDENDYVPDDIWDESEEYYDDVRADWHYYDYPPQEEYEIKWE